MNKTLLWNDILSQVPKPLPESLFFALSEYANGPKVCEPICTTHTHTQVILQTGTLPGVLIREGGRFIHTLWNRQVSTKQMLITLTGKF